MKLFISHSSYDKWIARQISNQLMSKGHNTFLDEKDIKTGESIDNSVQQHLESCDDLLLLITPESLKSQWVFIELGAAKALKKNIIPIFYHVGINQIPHVITQLLGRNLNDVERYYDELEERGKIKKGQTGIKLKRQMPPKNNLSNNLNIGDEVKVIEVHLLTDTDKDKEPYWMPEMDKYSGRKANVISFDMFGWPEIDIDSEKHAWHPEWLIAD